MHSASSLNLDKVVEFVAVGLYIIRIAAYTAICVG